MIYLEALERYSAEQLRDAVRGLAREVRIKQSIIDKLAFENATPKRMKHGRRAEHYSAEQKSLTEEALDADLAAVAVVIEALQHKRDKPAEKGEARRQHLPPELPRRDIRHEPASTTCGFGKKPSSSARPRAPALGSSRFRCRTTRQEHRAYPRSDVRALFHPCRSLPAER